MADSGLRLSWDFLASVFPESQHFAAQVDSLSSSYSSWRNVNPDGSLYRAVARSLLEHFCRPFTDLCELKRFYNRLYYQEFSYARHDKDLHEFVTVLCGLFRLHSLKRENSNEIMKACEEMLHSEEFMKPFINLLQHLAAAAFLECKPSPYYYKGVKEAITSQLEMGSLSSEIAYIGLGIALEMDFREVEMSRNSQVKEFKCVRRRLGQEPRLLVHVGTIEGNHYLFYPKLLERLETVDGTQYQALVDITAETVCQYNSCMRPQSS